MFALLVSCVLASLSSDLEGRWGGSCTVPGWPPVFSVLELDGEESHLSILQANILQQPLDSLKVEDVTFSFSMNIHGVVYNFSGTHEPLDPQLTGQIAEAVDPEGVGGTFEWTPYPPVVSMNGSRAYTGFLEIPGVTKLQMVLEMARDADNRLHADISIPAQKITEFPLEVLSDKESVVELQLSSSVPAQLNLELAEDELKGTFRQGAFRSDIEFTLDREADKHFNRPQEPQPPFPYTSREVVVKHPDGHSLAGTLTIPEGDGPHPVALLITGSGSQDRNEEIMGHKPFLVLSDHLTRNGIAVLRADDRGVGGSVVPDPASLRDVTTLDFASDTSVLVDHLKLQPEIDPARIGLIGHSEGGLVGPIVADQRDDIAFVVLMAGPGRPGIELLPDQNRALMQTAHVDPELIDKVVKQHALVMRMIMEGAPKEDIREPMRELCVMQISAAGLDMEVDEAFIDDAMAQANIPWLKWFLAFDPVPTLQRLDMPVYAINGSLDVQVPAETELTSIDTAIRDAGGDVTVKVYPGLNHLFQPATTGAVSEYEQIEITIDPKVLSDMSNWINSRMKNDE